MTCRTNRSLLSCLSSTLQNLSFFRAEDWNRWAQRWERYRRAADLVHRLDKDQKNLLIYTMDDRADDTLLSFKLSQEEQRSYDIVMDKFKTYFGEKRM